MKKKLSKKQAEIEAAKDALPKTKKVSIQKTAGKKIKKSSPKKISTHLKIRKVPHKIHANLHHDSSEFIPELPEGYGDNLICLMVRDPEWIYTYWEIQTDVEEWGLRELESTIDEVDSILRVYDLSESATYEVYFDIKLSDFANSWFIHVEPDHVYCVEIGLKRHRDGKYVCLRKSNISQTPPNEVSDVVDENWMGLDALKMYALSGGLNADANSSELQAFAAQKLLHHLSSGSGSGGMTSVNLPTSRKD